MKIDEIVLLNKIIDIQSCIIAGHSFKAILRKETAFFKKESGADIIAVCIANENQMGVEFILEERREFISLLRKHNLLLKHIDLNKFMEQCNKHYLKHRESVQIKSLYEIFEGTASKKKTILFEKEMSFNLAQIFPIHNKERKKIGFVVYFSTKETQLLEKKLPQITQVFETLISPFYDERLHLLHAKCIQVDSKMSHLTEKEKEIARSVLQGKAYKLIAYEMDITINTLKTHMKNIFSKYGVSSKAELFNKLIGNI
ncbi:helix-turn-helix transcriptional regulator [bacterium]|nr:helix-turn-helix transcriptional regulator [bacterium]MBU1989695.1 helix-turn-helix transcriptional regulator [bacterium]